MNTCALLTVLCLVLFVKTSSPGEPTAPSSDTKGRSVAILCDGVPIGPSNADPKVLADELASQGYTASLISAADLADSTVLNSGKFDCVILPYGPCYPKSADPAIKAYLKSGGSFVQMGGYAFDAPCVDESGKMVPLPDSKEPGLNTRHGKPGDTMSLSPEQIGVFDPTYHLLNSAGFRAAPMQSIVPPTLKVKTPVTGYAACSLLGSNNPVFPEKWGRHIPIANAYDKYGRSVGPIGSIAHNYAGSYAGSSWAFFGVTNTDLFAKNGPMLPFLADIVDAVTRKTYLHSLATDMACYKDGEWVVISAKLANLGRKPLNGTVVFSVYDRNGKSPIEIPAQDVQIEPGQTADLETEWRPLKFDSDLYRVTATLTVGGKTVDTMEIGFAASNPKVIAGGLKLTYKDNYFRVGDRPVLLSGTNATGAIFYSGNENPLVWDRDLARMQESGVNILRVLHFSPFVSDNPAAMKTKPLDLAIDELPISTERKLDALVQLCQKHKIALFLTLHDWMGVDLTDEELAAQRKFAKLIASRYRNVPGFMIDIQNEPQSPKNSDAPHITKLWNDWLRNKYKTEYALKTAWRVTPPEKPLGEIAYKPGTDAWDDMRTFDADAFRNFLVNRWIKANYDGAKEGDSNVPITVGFLQEYFALNKLMCVEGLDFANMHSYNDINTLRADLKLFDRRFEGKSLSLGEFGSVVDHQKRVDGVDSETQDWNRFLQTGHYVFGEGGSFLANWCWKDAGDVVFPWGINYPNDGPRKDILKAYRNQSLLFRQVRPVFEQPRNLLVIPSHMLLGGQAHESIKVLYKFVNEMLDHQFQFAVTDDEHLSKIPDCVVYYPIPYYIPDKTYNVLKAWVQKRGFLVLTGDFRYDANRLMTLSGRMEDFMKMSITPANPPGPGWENKTVQMNSGGASFKATLGEFMSESRQVGNGQVWYTPDPSARMDFGQDGAYLSDGLCIELGRNHVFQVMEQNASQVYVLANPTNTPQQAIPDEPPYAKQPLKMTVGPKATGMARYDKSGNALAVEAQGPLVNRGKTIPMKGHWALISCDGKDITESREMIMLPFGGGEVDLGNERRTSNIQHRTSNESENLKSEIRNPKSPGLVVQTGDVVNGKWVVLSESTDLKIKASGADAFDIRIVAPRARLAHLGQFVADELMLQSDE